MHGLDSEITVLWSSGIYLRLVHSLIFSVDAFSGWFTNMLNLEFFFGFMVPVSMALFDRGKLSCTSKSINGEQAIKEFGGEHLRIRSHESNTKRAGL